MSVQVHVHWRPEQATRSLPLQLRTLFSWVRVSHGTRISPLHLGWPVSKFSGALPTNARVAGSHSSAWVLHWCRGIWTLDFIACTTIALILQAILPSVRNSSLIKKRFRTYFCCLQVSALSLNSHFKRHQRNVLGWAFCSPAGVSMKSWDKTSWYKAWPTVGTHKGHFQHFEQA